MQSFESPRKSTPTVPSAEQIAARRHRLQRGISALRVALDCLPLAGQQRTVVLSIILAQEELLAAIEPAKPVPHKTKQLDAKAPKKTLSREEQARRTLEGQLKKQKRAERDKKIRMIEAKHRAEVEAVHRKSGYSEFMRRLPGSYEGGKK